MATDWHTDSNITEYTCYVDGGCINNGGPDARAYGSFKIFKNNKTLVHEDCCFPIASHGNAGRATNNMAESISINKAMTYFLHSQIITDPNIKIVINSDSELITSQINGFYKTKKANLKRIAADRKIIMDKIAKKAGRPCKEIFVIKKISRDRIFAVLGH